MRTVQAIIIGILIIIGIVFLGFAFYISFYQYPDSHITMAPFILIGIGLLLGTSSLAMNIKLLKRQRSSKHESDQLIDFDLIKDDPNQQKPVPNFLKVGNALFAIFILILLLTMLADLNLIIDKDGPWIFQSMIMAFIALQSYVVIFIYIGGVIRYIKYG